MMLAGGAWLWLRARSGGLRSDEAGDAAAVAEPVAAGRA
jgi:hypothetical protein